MEVINKPKCADSGKMALFVVSHISRTVLWVLAKKTGREKQRVPGIPSKTGKELW
jgi:hypothetical protein